MTSRGIWQASLVPPDNPTPARRSPLRAAVVTFGAVVLIGSIISFAILGLSGNLHDEPFARGQEIGRGVGVLGAVCAVVAYLMQQKRNGRR